MTTVGGLTRITLKLRTWYRKGADQGDAEAETNLGTLFLYGHGVKQDYSEALSWYRKGAEQGNLDAQNGIGWIYQNGLGVPQDKNEAAKWYSKAADQGNARALTNLIGLSQTQHAAGTIVHICSKGNTADCVTPPRTIFSPAPEFSKQASEAKYQGTCVLMLTVGADGLPNNVRVVKSLGKGLDEKAVEAVQKWKFEPAMKDGQPVAFELAVEVDFHLK